MGLPHWTSFVGCAGLETGAKIIALLHLIISTGAFIMSIMFTVAAKQAIGTEYDEGNLYTKWYYLGMLGIVASLVHIALAIGLFISVFKRYLFGIRVWVFVMMALWVGGLLFVIISSIVTGVYGSGSEIFLQFLECFVSYALVLYFILVVRSYHQMLKRSEVEFVPPKPY